MRIAVLISGHLRTFRETAKTWDRPRREHDIDFYCATWDTIDAVDWAAYRPAQERPRLSAEDIGDFNKLFSPKVFHVEENEPIRQRAHARPEYARLTKTSKAPPAAIEQQWHLAKISNELIQGQYDLVVRSRPDLNIERFQPVLPESKLIVCAQTRYKRLVADCMFMGAQEDMALALTLVDKFPQIIATQRRQAFSNPCLSKHLQESGLKQVANRKRIQIAILRSDGQLVA